MSFLKVSLHGATRQLPGAGPRAKPQPTGAWPVQGLGLSRGLGPRAAAAWGRGAQVGPGPRAAQTQKLSHFFVVLKSLLVGGWRRGGSQLKRLPQMWGPGGKRAVREKGRGFSPSPLLKPSNTPPKVGGS